MGMAQHITPDKPDKPGQCSAVHSLSDGRTGQPPLGGVRSVRPGHPKRCPPTQFSRGKTP